MKCAGCLHRNRDLLDAQIVQGVPYRSIAASFDISLGAISRHKRHVKEMIQVRTEAEREEHGSTLLERVLRLADEAEGILQSAKADKNLRAATAALVAACKLLDLCGRLDGQLRSANTPGLGLHLTQVKITNINNYGDSDPEWATMLYEATRGFDPAEVARLKLIAEKSSSVQPP